MNLNITSDRVLIERVVNEAKTSGGIIFSHTGEEKTNKGIVIGVGPGRTTSEDIVVPVDVKIGDTVIYNIKAGVDVKLEGRDFIMLKEEDIYLVVEE
jgi:chaperonin GroES